MQISPVKHTPVTLNLPSSGTIASRPNLFSFAWKSHFCDQTRPTLSSALLSGSLVRPTQISCCESLKKQELINGVQKTMEDSVAGRVSPQSRSGTLICLN